MVGLVRQRGRLGSVIVTRNDQYATLRTCASGVGMAKHITAPINTRTFSVPQGEHSVHFRAREQIDLLGAPHGRCCQIFVDAGLEDDAPRVEIALRRPERIVKSPQRRSPVPGNKTAGIEPGKFVSLRLE